MSITQCWLKCKTNSIILKTTTTRQDVIQLEAIYSCGHSLHDLAGEATTKLMSKTLWNKKPKTFQRWPFTFSSFKDLPVVSFSWTIEISLGFHEPGFLKALKQSSWTVPGCAGILVNDGTTMIQTIFSVKNITNFCFLVMSVWKKQNEICQNLFLIMMEKI